MSGFTAFNTTTVFERTRQQVNCFVLALSTTQFDLFFISISKQTTFMMH